MPTGTCNERQRESQHLRLLCPCMSLQTLECGLTQGLGAVPSTDTWAQAMPSAFKSPLVPRITASHSEKWGRKEGCPSPGQ